jgi:subtilase family serine protease
VSDQASGQFRVTYDQPAAQSGFVSFRATATDATGASVEQTITRAYQRAPSTLAAPPAAPAAPPTHDACPALPLPYAHCMAVVNDMAQPRAGQPAGYGPADIASAYNFPTGAGSGQTVAIVDALDDPNAEADLAAYRTQYGLPPCTTANGCFTKVNQRGNPAPLPSADPNWGLEISLDLDMVSAVCPNCHILLVEADTPLVTDLGTAVDTAVHLGADAVSNSYGTYGEPAGELTFDKYYRHPGHAIVAAAGDFGYNPSFPAVSPSVTAVGGTTLTRSGTGRGWSETAWSRTGGGCSAYERKPAWQPDPYCGMRMMNDISAVADPQTGVAVYDTFNQAGWVVVGGTSAGTPIIGAAYALAGNTDSVHDASGLYQHPGAFFDVTGGSNATPLFSCGGDYICTGVLGYDGPTGLGTPNGVGGL